MEDNKELRTVAVHAALELARGVSKTAEGVVKDAKTIYDFLEPEKDKEDENK